MYIGQKPEVPGYCVKEKDLEECSTHADCVGVGGGKCVALGRTGERYCLPKSRDHFPEEVPAVAEPSAAGGLGNFSTIFAAGRTHIDVVAVLTFGVLRRGLGRG